VRVFKKIRQTTHRHPHDPLHPVVPDPLLSVVVLHSRKAPHAAVPLVWADPSFFLRPTQVPSRKGRGFPRKPVSPTFFCKAYTRSYTFLLMYLKIFLPSPFFYYHQSRVNSTLVARHEEHGPSPLLFILTRVFLAQPALHRYAGEVTQTKPLPEIFVRILCEQ